MASQVSTSAAGGDSFLYSFTPGVAGRAGVAIPPSQPLSNLRRIGTQSMSGEPILKQEPCENITEPPASPRSNPLLTSQSTSLRSGSADRPHTVGSAPLSSTPLTSSPGPLGTGGIKPPALGAIGNPCLRHSLNAAPAGGLPKIDFHSGLGGVLSSPVELPALTMIGSMRRSLNAGIAAACDSSTASEGSLLNISGLDMPSPRQGILAPLRSPVLHSAGVQNTSPSATPGSTLGSNASSGPSSPTSTLGDTISPPGGISTSSYNGPSSLAGCGAGSAGGAGPSTGGGFPSTTGGCARRYGPTALSMDAPVAPMTPSGLAVYDAWASTPVTPPSAPPSLPTASPRRSLSANSRERAARGSSRPQEAAPSASGAAGFDHDDPNCITAVKLLSGINDDIQRAAGAMSALHASGSKPLTVAQLAALRKSAPELREEIRGAVRRAFQVLRQEVSAVAAVGSRQLVGCVEGLGATLDAYFEDMAGLTSALVDGSIAAATRTSDSAGNTVNGGSDDTVSATRLGPQSGAQDMQRQLERMRLRLMEAEKRAAAAEAAAREAAGGVAIAGTGPRPPIPLASPPLERGPGASPRRGRHARALSTDGGISASGNGDCVALADIGDTGSSLSKTESRRLSRGTLSLDGASGGINLRAECGSGNREGSNTSDGALRSFERAVGVACGSSKGSGELVIEEEASDEEVVVDEGAREARRRMLTIHSASFAEWARRR